MGKIQYIVWFVLFRKVSCTLYIERHEQDVIKNTDMKSCFRYDGAYDDRTKTCICSRNSSLLLSPRDVALRCTNIKTSNCKIKLQDNFMNVWTTFAAKTHLKT